MDQAHKLPRPYLNRDETDARLILLGFQMRQDKGGTFLRDSPRQREMIVALEELISSAIASWVNLDVGFESATEELIASDANAELLEWTEEYLVG